MKANWLGLALCAFGLAACKHDDDDANPPPPPPATTFSIGGNVTGLAGTVVLRNNGGDNLSVNASGAFTFATRIASGNAYAVSVLTQPAGQTCVVSSGSGNAAANVTNVAVTCANNPVVTFTIGGSVSGLAGTVVLQNNAAGNLTITTSGAFTFAAPVTSGNAYAVTVLTQPAGQTCAVANGSGTAAANVTNVAVTCTNNPPPTFTIGGTVGGLTGTLVLQNNGIDPLNVAANGAFTFAAPIADGGFYAVGVHTQPSGQECTVTNGSGTVTANVSNVVVTCLPLPTGTTLTLELRPGGVFHFSWTAIVGASEYRLLEDATGNSGFTQVGIEIAGSVTSFDHLVPLHQRVNARYLVQACAQAACADSNTVNVSGPMTAAIGYLKASNPDASDTFGVGLELSGDGNTLVVSTPNEDSESPGINGDQSDNFAPSAGAAYVFVRAADGSWSQQAYLKASNAGEFDTFGYSVAISTDGNTIAIGAPTDDSGARGIDGNQTDDSETSSGAVFVFTRTGTTWTQQAYVKASNTEDQYHFGWDVGLSGSGNTLVVGASGDAGVGSGVDGDQSESPSGASGAAFVFERSGSAWAQAHYLKASNPGDADEFGSAIAISRDGDTIAVGSPSENSAATGVNGNQADESKEAAGAVYVFARSGSTWVQQAYVKASNPDASDLFGKSVTLSANGNVLAIAAPNEDSLATGINGAQTNGPSDTDSGAVYLFNRVATTWIQTDYVKSANSEARDFFAASLALSDDGRLLVVGSSGEDGNALGLGGDATNNSRSDAGAAYLFTRISGVLTQSTYIKASNTASNDVFGGFVTLSADGSVLAVAALGEDSAATGLNGDAANNSLSAAGAVYIY